MNIQMAIATLRLDANAGTSQLEAYLLLLNVYAYANNAVFPKASVAVWPRGSFGGRQAMSQGNAAIILVTDSNSQTHLFMEYIAERLGCRTSAVSPDETLELVESSKILVLLDAAAVDESSMQQWHTMAAEREDVTLAAINLREEDHAAEVLASLHLKGVFYRRDSMALICKGIRTLLDDRLWMSRSLMTRLIEIYRRQQLNAYRPVGSLTHRELEIIGLLSSGASNIEIANMLFVSEHTIKSHLYNIFRKIEVRNRIQAMNWARQNLGAPPTHIDRKRRQACR
ncbi:LuxR family transcriptional regulator [Salinisphaera shabanensis T35B1]|uniref:LuxR C-terminal-related transcriptional regulator n=1 Tax=Salinisphaera shabanensis TaxID=180542 RepID=UPI00333FE499